MLAITQEADGSERRRYARQDVKRPCKIFRPATCRYTAAVTRNVSASGVLLEIMSPRAFVPGERLNVGVAWTRSPLVAADHLLEGRVVRVTELDEDRQEIAVAFEDVAELAAVA